MDNLKEDYSNCTVNKEWTSNPKFSSYIVTLFAVLAIKSYVDVPSME